MSISSVGTPSSLQVPEILWATGPDASIRRDQSANVDAQPSPDTGVSETKASPNTVAETRTEPPEQTRAAPVEGQGRLVDRLV